jgi:EAL domain-containing protein (putative c-di-GMP-specific phosphodiesterase class I)/DNA-binding CsgD family transcriptional regulator
MAAIHHAFEYDGFRLLYQPRISIDTERVVGVEALVRWILPEGELIAPADVVPASAGSSWIGGLTEWVLERACQHLADWQSMIPGLSLTIAVNVSSLPIGPRLTASVQEALVSAGIQPSGLSLEFTEAAMMRDLGATRVLLRELRELGVKVVLDGFGGGHQSLVQLHRLPIDSIKVDRTFVHGLGQNPLDNAIVCSVISMAHAIRCSVVATGVETQLQLEELRQLGCDEAQGYLVAPPMDASDFASSLTAGGRGQQLALRFTTEASSIEPAPKAVEAVHDRLQAAAGDEPIDPEPIESEPIDSEPIDSEPIDSEPIRSIPVDDPVATALVHSRLDHIELPERQHEIVQRLLRGERVPTIARDLYLSQSTVRNHLCSIFRKFGVNSQEELLRLLYGDLNEDPALDGAIVARRTIAAWRP